MDRDLLRTLTMEQWPVELVESDGLWETAGLQTLMFLPPFLGPGATMLLHRLAFTYPTPWTTDDLAAQLGLKKPRVLEALDRAASFGFVEIGSIGIEVPSRLGPLSNRLLSRIPAPLRRAHNRLLEH